MTYLTDAERASFDRRNVKESKQWVTEIVLGQVFQVSRVSMAGKINKLPARAPFTL